MSDINVTSQYLQSYIIPTIETWDSGASVVKENYQNVF